MHAAFEKAVIEYIKIVQAASSEQDFINALEAVYLIDPGYVKYIHVTLHDGIMEHALCTAARLGYTRAASRLLEMGVGLDCGEVSTSGSNLTPLMRAANWDHLEICEILIAHNADIYYKSMDGRNVLSMIREASLFKFFLDKASHDGKVEKLLDTNIIGAGYLEHLLWNQEFDQILILLENPQTRLFLDPFKAKALLHITRMKYWESSQHQDTCDAICHLIRQKCRHLTLHTPCDKLTETKAPSELSFAECYQKLFGQLPSESTKDLPSKEQLGKVVLAHIYSLFLSPLNSVQYLVELDQEFGRYLKEKKQPKLDINFDTLALYDINDLRFYYPLESYQPNKKNHSLPEFLTSILQQHGLSEIEKWAGFVPDEKARAHLGEGKLFIEARLRAGLFHGKLTHLLQYAMVICWLRKSNIDLSYVEDNIRKKLTLKDILILATELKAANSNENLHVRIFDKRDFLRILFCDPQRLHSLIMTEGNSLGLSHLVAFLVDSFCKGFMHLKDLCDEVYGKKFSHKNLMDIIADMNAEAFDEPEILMKAYTQKHETSVREACDKPHYYSRFYKKYSPHPTFVPFEEKEVESPDKKCSVM